jgi:Poxvirus Late Transcription Factor VLTF3 like
MHEASPIIEKYKSIGTITRVVSFKPKSQKTDRAEDLDKYTYRHSLISNYLEIARKYISLNVIHEKSFDNRCPACELDLKDVPIDDECGVQVCSCGFERRCLTRTSVYSDSSKQSTGRNGYDDRDNFLKALRRHEGKQPNHLPENLIDVLDRHFTSFGLPAVEEVRRLPLIERGPRQGTKEGTSRDMMFRALYETNNVAYYEDINLICHLTWGWALPDISYLEDQIMDDYDKTQRIYESLPKDRKSNLNIQYRLFKHLEMRRHRCYIDDFKIVKTRDILEYHDSIWRLMIEGAKQAHPEHGFIFIETI